jgi:hypothetical protein
MKFSTYGDVTWNSFLSLGIASFFTKGYITITVFIGPFTRTFELYTPK